MNSPVEWLLNPELEGKLAKSSRLDQAFADGVRPDPDLTVSQWADEHRILSSESSAEYGLWRTSRVPFMREIMDVQSPTHPCRESGLLKGTQIAGSETMYNVIGAAISQFPCPILLVMPTTDMAKLTSKQRVQPMIEATPQLHDKVKAARSRDSGNTVLLKQFRGGVLRITGANSGPGLRSMPVRILLCDEIDAWPADVGGEGDPMAVARKRTATFGARKKEFFASSPKIKGSSRIDRYYQAGTQAQLELPCPHCTFEQPLVWSQMRWSLLQRRELVCRSCGGISPLAADSAAVCAHCSAPATGAEDELRLVDTDDVERVWYECASCQGEIEERHKTVMLARGRHIHRTPGPGRWLAEGETHPHAIWARDNGVVRRYLPTFARPLTWHVSALYSPLGWYSWTEAVKDWLEAQKGGFDDESGESLEQVFINTVLGEAYEAKGEQPDVNVLALRAEPYELGTVPAGALLLVAAIDVQGNRLEVKVKGYGRGEESWLIDYQVLHGDPTLTGPGSVWEQAIALRDRAYRHAGGNSIYITAMAVDSGYLTQTVYDFCRKWSYKHVYAVKGDSKPGKAIIGAERKVDFSHTGKAVKRGASVRIVGIDTVKERIFANLAIEKARPGYMHFPRGLPNEYFEQLTAEKKIERRKKGRVVYEYHKTRERNEALDLEVYCYAIAVLAGLKRVNWDLLEQTISPTQREIFAAPATTNQGADAAPPTGRDTSPTAAALEAPPTSPAVQTAAHSRGRKPQPARPIRPRRWSGW